MSYDTLTEALDELRGEALTAERVLRTASKKDRPNRVWQETHLAELEGQIAGIELALSYAPGRPTVEDEVHAAVGGIPFDTGCRVMLCAAEFLYRPGSRPEVMQERTVSLYESDGVTVLGWDHNREGIRRFRLDCIEAGPNAHFIRAAGPEFREPLE